MISKTSMPLVQKITNEYEFITMIERVSLLLKMNKKLETIKTLKSKLYQIQNHLESITSDDKKIQVSPIKCFAPKPNFNSSHNPYYRNPTFWGKNPILNKENQEKSDVPPNPEKPKSKRSLQRRSVPDSIQKIMNNIQLENYQSAPQSTKKALSSPYAYDLSLGRKQQNCFRRKRSPPKYDSKGETPRFQKIKTYTIERTNPILSPDPQKSVGKKIVRRICRSPENPYTDNPGSDGWMYMTQERKPYWLSPTHGKTSQKNSSPNIREILSSSLQLKDNKRRGSNKKHYPRYFEDTFVCHWT